MSTATQNIVNKAWNFAHVLRDDGLPYMAYTEQITFLLFLKMADELTKPPYNRKPIVPPALGCRLQASLKAKKRGGGVPKTPRT
jgi:type I restriction enzyme M protein